MCAPRVKEISASRLAVRASASDETAATAQRRIEQQEARTGSDGTHKGAPAAMLLGEGLRRRIGCPPAGLTGRRRAAEARSRVAGQGCQGSPELRKLSQVCSGALVHATARPLTGRPQVAAWRPTAAFGCVLAAPLLLNVHARGSGCQLAHVFGNRWLWALCGAWRTAGARDLCVGEP